MSDNPAVFALLRSLCNAVGFEHIPLLYLEQLAAAPALSPARLTEDLMAAAGPRAMANDRPVTGDRLRRLIHEGVTSRLRYTCPCCGSLVYLQPPGSYQLCHHCAWEDDALQLEFATTLAGGANRPSLLDAQQAWGTPRSPDLARLQRAAGTGLRHDPDWRPIGAADRFPDWAERQALRAPAIDLRLYYWRRDYWYRDPKAI